MEADKSLLAYAREITTGANLDYIKTLIFGYKDAVYACNAGGPYRPQFEAELRDVVTKERFNEVVAKATRLELRCRELFARSEEIDRKIDQFFRERSVKY